MKLIDLLVQELPKRGGWPEAAEFCVYEHIGKKVRFTKHGAPKFKNKSTGWTILEDNYSFWILDEGFYWIDTPSDFSKCIVIKAEYEAAIAASKQVEWCGDGVPPVGCECEVSSQGGWKRCKINYMSNILIVYQMVGRCTECASVLSGVKFRPIRTETERKREDCSAMIEALFYTTNSEGDYLRGAGVYDAIAAGKIPGIKLAD